MGREGRGTCRENVARPPRDRRAGGGPRATGVRGVRRAAWPRCRISPAQPLCGGFATDGPEGVSHWPRAVFVRGFATDGPEGVSPRPRATGVRGFCDRRSGRGVASAPHGACEGVSRRKAARKCRIGPAPCLCGGFATDGPEGVSHWPRAAAARGLRDGRAGRGVASAPHGARAGVSRRKAARKCRIGPAQCLCGGFATDGPEGVSYWPRAVFVRGFRDGRDGGSPPQALRDAPRETRASARRTASR